MNEKQNTIELLNKLIEQREEHFIHSLCENSEQSIISHLKSDIDFLKEKRKQLVQEINMIDKKILN